MTPISDALVLVLDEGSPLSELDRGGVFGRRSALWEALGERHGRLVLVSHDRGEAVASAKSLAGSIGAECVCDEQGTYAHEHMDRAAIRVAKLLKGCESVVVQTVGLMSSPTAVAVASELSRGGCRVALVAEAEDLWSRQSIGEFGPTSRAALKAAFREQLACTSAHVVLAGCGPVADDLVWRFNLSADRVRVVPLPVVEPGRSVPAEAREKCLVLAFGPATHRARLEIAVEAVAMLRRADCPDARLKVLLGGPEASGLMARAESLNVPLEIVGNPTADEVDSALSRCTVLVHTSTSETNPYGVFRAMAVGTPVLLAVDPLCALEVVHGVSGLRMPAEPEALERALAGLLVDAPWRDSLGGAGRERVAQERGVLVACEAILAAQAFALDVAARAGRGVCPQMVLASEGLAELGPQESAQAWARAIAEFLGRVGDNRPAYASALAGALGGLNGPARSAPAA